MLTQWLLYASMIFVIASAFLFALFRRIVRRNITPLSAVPLTRFTKRGRRSTSPQEGSTVTVYSGSPGTPVSVVSVPTGSLSMSIPGGSGFGVPANSPLAAKGAALDPKRH